MSLSQSAIGRSALGAAIQSPLGARQRLTGAQPDGVFIAQLVRLTQQPPNAAALIDATTGTILQITPEVGDYSYGALGLRPAAAFRHPLEPTLIIAPQNSDALTFVNLDLSLQEIIPCVAYEYRPLMDPSGNLYLPGHRDYWSRHLCSKINNQRLVEWTSNAPTSVANYDATLRSGACVLIGTLADQSNPYAIWQVDANGQASGFASSPPAHSHFGISLGTDLLEATPSTIRFNNNSTIGYSPALIQATAAIIISREVRYQNNDQQRPSIATAYDRFLNQIWTAWPDTPVTGGRSLGTVTRNPVEPLTSFPADLSSLIVGYGEFPDRWSDYQYRDARLAKIDPSTGAVLNVVRIGPPPPATGYRLLAMARSIRGRTCCLSCSHAPDYWTWSQLACYDDQLNCLWTCDPPANSYWSAPGLSWLNIEMET